MIETDYVWLKPLVALPAEAPASRAQGFPFGYIAPQVAPDPWSCKSMSLHRCPIMA